MNLYTFKTISDNPSLLRVNVSTFRRKLKDYLQLTKRYKFTKKGEQKIIVVENHEIEEAIVLSRDSLYRLQERHTANTVLQCYYRNLNLSEYTTIMNGCKTKDLPADVISALCALFQVIQEVLDYVSRPYLCEDLETFPIHDYIRPLYDNTYPFVSGAFGMIHTVTKKLNLIYSFHNVNTMSEFFMALFNIADKKDGPNCLQASVEGLTQEQADMVGQLIASACSFAGELLSFQDIFYEISPLHAVYGSFWEFSNEVKDSISGELLELPVHAVRTRNCTYTPFIREKPSV